MLIYSRYPEFRCQLYHTMLQLRRVSEVAADSAEQAQPCLGVHSQTRVAPQLAYLHQRDNILLPYELVDMRK
jgi:hypothetical protein